MRELDAELGAVGAAAVLTHPAFDRPPVVNVRRPGRKAGAVSLLAARRRRDRAQLEAQRADHRNTQPHDLAAERRSAEAAQAGPPTAADVAATGRGLVGSCGISTHPAMAGDALIAAALAVLDTRLRRPGGSMSSPQHVREFLALHLAERDREAFGVLYLDSQHALIEFAVMFEGTLSQTAVYPREIARRALALNAGAVIVAHNHPSGNPEPSGADVHLTAVLRQALALVDVKLLDHVIVGRLRAISMAERGML